MKQFLKKCIILLVPIIFLFSLGLLLRPTPNSKMSFLFAQKAKDSLLKNVSVPRLIFVGGSNLSFGLNSLKIKDSLQLFPINTAIHAGLGIQYMLENTISHIRKGDVIIVAPEYQYFFKSYDDVSDELLRMVVDVDVKKYQLLSLKQKVAILSYIPKFTLTKFKPTEYWGWKESDIYSVNSFNLFGDVNAHWKLKSPGYFPEMITGDINESVIEQLKLFEQNAERKGAVVYISFPSFDEVSFSQSREKIFLYEQLLHKYKFKILGSSERYVMPKSMMFNTSYHLTKEGVDYRTDLLIQDLRKWLIQ